MASNTETGAISGGLGGATSGAVTGAALGGPTGALVGAGVGLVAGSIGGGLSGSAQDRRAAAIGAALETRRRELSRFNDRRANLRDTQSGMLQQSGIERRENLSPVLSTLSNRQGSFNEGVAGRGAALRKALAGAQRSTRSDSSGFADRQRGVQNALTEGKTAIAEGQLGDLRAATASSLALRGFNMSEADRNRQLQGQLGDIQFLRGRTDLDDLLSNIRSQGNVASAQSVGASTDAFGQAITGVVQAAPGVAANFAGPGE